MSGGRAGGVGINWVSADGRRARAAASTQPPSAFRLPAAMQGEGLPCTYFEIFSLAFVISPIFPRLQFQLCIESFGIVSFGMSP